MFVLIVEFVWFAVEFSLFVGCGCGFVLVVLAASVLLVCRRVLVWCGVGIIQNLVFC